MQYMQPKDPAEVLDYTLDWDAELGTGEEISGTPVWTVPDGITKDSQANTTTTATIWLSGGTAGVEYAIACKITTNNSVARVHEKTIVVPVLQD